MRTIFTTGQVAKICKVAPRTVSKWFDSGRLRGYRIPGSQDRRIPRDHLVRFLKEHGMPLGDLDDDPNRALLVSSDHELENLLASQYEVTRVPDSFTAGDKFSEQPYRIVFVDSDIPEARTIAEVVKKGSEDVLVIAFVRDHERFDTSAFHEAFRLPVDFALVTERVKTLLSRKERFVA